MFSRWLNPFMKVAAEMVRRVLGNDTDHGPRDIQRAKGRKRSNRENRCRDLVKSEKFDAKAWNEFCSSMIELVGGGNDGVTTQSIPLFDEAGRVVITISRLSAQYMDRGSISVLPLPDGKRPNFAQESVIYGTDDALDGPKRRIGASRELAQSYVTGEDIVPNVNWNHGSLSKDQARVFCEKVFEVYTASFHR